MYSVWASGSRAVILQLAPLQGPESPWMSLLDKFRTHPTDSLSGKQVVDSAYWSRPTEQLLQELFSSSKGLTQSQAESTFKRLGANALADSTSTSTWGLLISQFKSPLVLILIVASVISMFAAEWIDAGVVLAIVLGSTLLGFGQEFMAGNAIEKLRTHVKIHSLILRDDQARKQPSDAVVPGDVVLLSAGSLIPADGVVLEAKDFFINQAVLTGETFPVEKKPGVVNVAASLSERSNAVFMGTSVSSGTARVLVVQTGKSTVFGQIAGKLALRPPMTEFERGIHRFGYLLTRIMGVMVVIVLAINMFMAKPPIDSLLFALALAVGLTPELLPAIVSITLSHGAKRMGQASTRVLKLAGINAQFQSGLANPLDEAVTAALQKAQLDVAQVNKRDEIPYDFVRKCLSVVVDEAGVSTLITKGALDKVLARCVSVGAGLPLDAACAQRIEAQFDSWSEQGFRVLGVASREIDARSVPYTRDDESGLSFEGFLLFMDPPKPDVQQTLRDLAQRGVQLKIITGDNHKVARHVAQAVGLPVTQVVTGRELHDVGDEALMHIARQATVFAEVDPNQKERIILALQKTGHVVGYMGDGINDALALHAADVGISVDTAVDVAKDAADFVLLRKDLNILCEGIDEGRMTFANTLKYILTTISANFGNMVSMAVASVFLPFLPLLASQILLNSFLADIPATTIAGDRVDPESVAQPRHWDTLFIRNYMLVFGLLSSAFDFMAFGVLLWVFQARPEEFRTGWFVVSLMTQLVIALVVRTRRPFYLSRPGTGLWVSSAVVLCVALSLPYWPWSAMLGFVPLPISLMGGLVGLTVAYVVAVELEPTEGSWVKQRIGMRLPRSAQP
eukprot:gene14268-16403_t